MLLPLCDRNFTHYLHWVSCRSCFEIRIQILCQLGFHLRLMSIYISWPTIFWGLDIPDNEWDWKQFTPVLMEHPCSKWGQETATTVPALKQNLKDTERRAVVTSLKIRWEASMREWQDRGLKKSALIDLSAMNWNLSSLQTGDKLQFWQQMSCNAFYIELHKIRWESNNRIGNQTENIIRHSNKAHFLRWT